MNATLLTGSQKVILELRAYPESDPVPQLEAILLSIVRSSGTYEAARIDLQASGISKPYQGDTWRAEWRRDGGWILRLAVPDQIFEKTMDPVQRFALEVLCDGNSGTPLDGISVTVVPMVGPAWLPPEYVLL